jgi:hypothetical protein
MCGASFVNHVTNAGETSAQRVTQLMDLGDPLRDQSAKDGTGTGFCERLEREIRRDCGVRVKRTR